MEFFIDQEKDAVVKQTPYKAASNACVSLDTVVPASMADSQQKFNDRFKAAIVAMGMTVEEYVAKKLHYPSVDDLCFQDELDDAGNRLTRLGAEQIDAIGIAIWNHETNNNGIIIADVTGLGKGRQIAGILRYAILELKTIPFFFTEKKHLINDIYRDLIAIGFDAGVPKKFRKTVIVEDVSNFSDEKILKIIIQDIRDKDDIRIEFSFPEWFNIEWIRRGVSDTHERYDEIEELKEELIEAYRQHFTENGYEKDVYENNINYEQDVVEAMRKCKMLLEPFVPNLIDIKDINGNILYEAPTKEEVAAIYQLKKDGKKFSEDPNVQISQLVLPSRFKLFAMPYSQVGTAKFKFEGREYLKNKIKLFQKYSHKSVIILDEAHGASGTVAGELSNTGEIIFSLVKNSSMTTYVSATYAKRADNMPLYALKTSIRESGLSDSEMINTFLQGGNALQEAVSSEISRNGQLLRRERLIQGKTEYYYENEDSETGKNQISKLDRVASLYGLVLDFNDQVKSVISEFKKPLPEDEKAKIKNARGVNALAFQLFKFMLLGLKVKQTTEFAINKLRSGQKTIIAVASTMESALDNLSKNFTTNLEADKYSIGDEIKNDFSLYLAHLLNYTMRYNKVEVIVDEEGNKEEIKRLVYVLDSKDELSTYIKDRLLTSYLKRLENILSFETGIPIAPIDMIEKNIKQAGFSINEITGRQRKVVFENSNTSIGKIVKRDVKKTDVIVREFNENEIDCLIINQSGATGISMQAIPNKKVTIVYQPQINEHGVLVEFAPKSLENKKEVKKRHMIITDMELDVNKEVQKLGRINRMGQVYLPGYTYTISAIPSEARLTSLMEKKLRSLSANVSSDQTQSDYLFTSDDFFSDIAVSPFNETLKEIGYGATQVSTGSQIQDFTKSLYFKDYKIQKSFYDTFSKKLQKEIETLKSQGLYTGQMSYKDYKAETIIKHPFYIGDNNATTSFGRHSFIEKCVVKMYRERFIEQKIELLIKEKLVIKGNLDDGKDDLYFTDLKEYQKKSINILNEYEKQKTQSINEKINLENDDLSRVEKDIDAAKKESEKFSEIEAALNYEVESDKNSKTISELTKKIADAASKGEMEKISEYSSELSVLHAKKKEIDEKLKSYKDVLEQENEYKNLMRGLKRLISSKEAILKRIASYEKNILEFSELIENSKKWVSQIGKVMQLDVYDPKITYDEFDDGRVLEFKPNKIFSRPTVVIGVSFPNDYYDLTPGKFEVYLCSASEKYSYNLYRIEQKDPYEQTVHLSKILNSYKDGWNKIAGQEDNSYTENKYMIVGSLLKTFSLGKSNQITGQIIKYTTSENKTRIGIEVSDNEDKEQGEKSVYKILDQRYGADAILQRAIYYDGNKENVKKFIEQYIYWYMFGETYEKLDKNISPEEGSFQNIFDRNFYFQISSAEKQMFIIVRCSDNNLSSAKSHAEFYNKRKGEIPESMRVSKENLFSDAKVEIVSDSVSATDFMAYHFNIATGIDIGPDNYEVSGKSRVFTNVKKSYGSMAGKITPGRGSQFKTFFPTNLIELDSILMHGVPYRAALSMDYSDFNTLIEYLSKKRMKPTFATSSLYFERHKGDFILEQFLDDVEQINDGSITDVVKNVEFFEQNKNDIDALIDDLLKSINEYGK